jgi:hypothetical protein
VLPLHGSAHNVYAQTFSGKGIAGLLSLLAIPILFLVTARRLLSDQSRSLSAKLVALTGACFGCAFLIYGNVQEVFYVQSLQFLFFGIAGIVAAVGNSSMSPLTPKTLKALSAVVLGTFLLHSMWEFGTPGNTRDLYTERRYVGCYPQEVSPEGRPFQWCGERATITKTVTSSDNAIVLRLQAGPREQNISVSLGNDSETHVTTLRAGESQDISLPLDSARIQEGHVDISFRATTSFVPALEWQDSTDPRRLAFRLSYPESK